MMEFLSLKESKDVVLEHNALMGRKVKYAKNDRQMVRMVCKFKNMRGHTVLVSRVVRSMTYMYRLLLSISIHVEESLIINHLFFLHFFFACCVNFLLLTRELIANVLTYHKCERPYHSLEKRRGARRHSWHQSLKRNFTLHTFLTF